MHLKIYFESALVSLRAHTFFKTLETSLQLNCEFKHIFLSYKGALNFFYFLILCTEIEPPIHLCTKLMPKSFILAGPMTSLYFKLYLLLVNDREENMQAIILITKFTIISLSGFGRCVVHFSQTRHNVICI